MVPVHESGGHSNEKRFKGGADRLRAPARVALLETATVVRLSIEGISVSSVLDVGTGTGIFAEAFAAAGFKVAGIEPNPELLLHARVLVPGAEFLAGTAERLPFARGAYDVVFLGHVLHETDDPHAALSEARRVAKHRVAVLEWPYQQEDQGPPLAHRLEEARIRQIAAAAGFTSIELIPLSHMHLYRMQ